MMLISWLHLVMRTDSRQSPRTSTRSPWRPAFIVSACAMSLGLAPAAELEWNPNRPDVLAGTARETTQVRIELNGSDVCLDEVVILAPGGTDNLALSSKGAKAGASSSLAGSEQWHSVRPVIPESSVWHQAFTWIAASGSSALSGAYQIASRPAHEAV